MILWDLCVEKDIGKFGGLRRMFRIRQVYIDIKIKSVWEIYVYQENLFKKCKLFYETT